MAFENVSDQKILNWLRNIVGRAYRVPGKPALSKAAKQATLNKIIQAKPGLVDQVRKHLQSLTTTANQKPQTLVEMAFRPDIEAGVHKQLALPKGELPISVAATTPVTPKVPVKGFNVAQQVRKWVKVRVGDTAKANEILNVKAGAYNKAVESAIAGHKGTFTKQSLAELLRRTLNPRIKGDVAAGPVGAAQRAGFVPPGERVLHPPKPTSSQMAQAAKETAAAPAAVAQAPKEAGPTYTKIKQFMKSKGITMPKKVPTLLKGAGAAWLLSQLLGGVQKYGMDMPHQMSMARMQSQLEGINRPTVQDQLAQQSLMAEQQQTAQLQQAAMQSALQVAPFGQPMNFGALPQQQPNPNLLEDEGVSFRR